MFANKTLQAITNVGTGSYQLNTTGTGAWQTWRSQFSTGAQVGYYAESEDGTTWEYGYGTLTTGTPDQITRNVISSSTGSIIDWTTADGTVYVMSVPWSQAFEGRWDSANSMFVAAGRKPWTATGTSGLTVTTAHAGGRYSFDTSAAARTVTLPAIADVPMGFNLEVWGLSASYPLILDPAGSDAIDSTAGGTNVALAGNCNALIFSDGTKWRTVNRVTPTLGVPRGHIDGLALSTAGSSATFSVAAGEATDKNQTKVMKLASAMSKTTSAWSAGTGNGALDTGTIANGTWYHAYLIENLATGAVDVLVSLSASSPTLPAGYTLSRELGSMKTDGSAQWVKFKQVGDTFLLDSAVADVNGVTLNTTNTQYTLASIPSGKNVTAIGELAYNGGGTGTVLLTSSLVTAPTSLATGRWTMRCPGTLAASGRIYVETDTSAKINVVVDFNCAPLYWYTEGWIDRRGRDA